MAKQLNINSPEEESIPKQGASLQVDVESPKELKEEKEFKEVKSTPANELFNLTFNYNNLLTSQKLNENNKTLTQNQIKKAEIEIRNESKDKDPEEVNRLVNEMRRKISGDNKVSQRGATDINMDFTRENIVFPLPEYEDQIPERIKESQAYRVVMKNFVEIAKNWLDAGVTDVSIAITENPNGTVKINIKDNGPGFGIKFLDPGTDEEKSYQGFLPEQGKLSKIKSDKEIGKDFGGAGRGLAGMYKDLAGAGGDLTIANIIVEPSEFLSSEGKQTFSELEALSPSTVHVAGASMTLSSPIGINPDETNTLIAEDKIASDEEEEVVLNFASAFKNKKPQFGFNSENDEASTFVNTEESEISILEEESEISILPPELERAKSVAIDFVQEENVALALPRTHSLNLTDLGEENADVSNIASVYKDPNKKPELTEENVNSVKLKS